MTPISRRELLVRMAWAFPLTVIPLGNLGCDVPHADPANAAPASAPRPVRLALFIDKSKSVIENDVRPPSLEDLVPIIDRLGVAGGELAVGRIAVHSNISLERLRVEAPPGAPERPSEDMNPLDLNDAMEAYTVAARAHEKQMETWTAEEAQKATEFLSRVRPILEGPPDASSTDIWGAVRRADMFLSEPSGPSNVEPVRILVLVTDGIDTANSRPVTPSVPIQVAFVGARDIERYQTLHPKLFESSASALRWVIETAQGTKGGR